MGESPRTRRLQLLSTRQIMHCQLCAGTVMHCDYYVLFKKKFTKLNKNLFSIKFFFKNYFLNFFQKFDFLYILYFFKKSFLPLHVRIVLFSKPDVCNVQPA